MNLRLITLILVLYACFPICAQTICGYVTDKNTGERLPGANFREIGTFRGISSDANGFYCLSFQRESSWIVSMIGYTSDTIMYTESSSYTFTIELKPLVVELPGIDVVQAHSANNFKEGKFTFSPISLSRVPSLGGERDIIKTLTVFPGIAGGNEGFSSFSVRGGGTDQNLFVLDGAHIYNTGHLFNFFSIFNSDALKSVTIYKNYYPPRFGGRLSSVTDIQFRDGNNQKTEFKVDLGIINSKIAIEGPLGRNNKTSYILAMRSSYLDLFKTKKIKRFYDEKPSGFYDDVSDFGYTFADFNFKVNHNFNSANRIQLTLFGGADYYKVWNIFYTSVDNTRFDRFNTLASLKSFHLIDSRLFVEFIASFNRQSNEITERNTMFWRDVVYHPETRTFSYIPYLLSRNISSENSGLHDFSLESHTTYNIGKNTAIKSGLSAIKHFYNPGIYANTFSDTLATIGKILAEPASEATEMALYSGIETTLFFNLNIMGGQIVNV